MKKQAAFSVLAAFAFLFLGATVMLAHVQRAEASQTTVTSSIIGWLVPDGAHWNNGIGALLWPILGVSLFTLMGKVMNLNGDIIATLALVGLVIGSIMGDLTNGTITAVASVPFALIVVASVDLVLWVWQGGGK